ncbi:hypothetical protein GUJ93_ZPchr0013g33844 [Zizania palustris]|uniref:Uncharacterized protein n=1 Tax=Zizania palustris TaxID=103762 RepID=A0A8J5X2Y6_ZIZPA|nr:hypothetical protein GUJ93_ZPchr0013g33844 [Zizania palustris]
MRGSYIAAPWPGARASAPAARPRAHAGVPGAWLGPCVVAPVTPHAMACSRGLSSTALRHRRRKKRRKQNLRTRKNHEGREKENEPVPRSSGGVLCPSIQKAKLSWYTVSTFKYPKEHIKQLEHSIRLQFFTAQESSPAKLAQLVSGKQKAYYMESQNQEVASLVEKIASIHAASPSLLCGWK